VSLSRDRRNTKERVRKCSETRGVLDQDIKSGGSGLNLIKGGERTTGSRDTSRKETQDTHNREKKDTRGVKQGAQTWTAMSRGCAALSTRYLKG